MKSFRVSTDSDKALYVSDIAWSKQYPSEMGLSRKERQRGCLRTTRSCRGTLINNRRIFWS